MLALKPPGSPARRDAALELVTGRRWDLLVVGAGITGVAVARDAALRGLSVAVVEADDLAFGTSSRSSRLVHGGLRYLASLDVGLVREGVVERHRLLETAPGIVRPERFIYLVYCDDPDSLWKVRTGVRLYGLVAAGHRLGSSRPLSRADLERELPGIRTDCLDGAVSYLDAETHDSRLTVALAAAVTEMGVPIVTRCRVDSLVSARGRTTGARVTDTVRDTGHHIAARVVALCTGPWQALHADVPPRIRTARGTHVSVHAHRLPIAAHLAMRSPRDGRQTFALPFGAYTVLGTTDTDDHAPPGEVRPTTDDTDYLLEVANHIFPSAALSRRDVVGAWAGLRPLVADDSARSPDALSRRHRIVEVEPGRWVLAGGKLTTHRRMAEDLLDRILSREDFDGRRLEPCSTRKRPLVAAERGTARVELERLKAPAGTIAMLTRLYGGRLGRVTHYLRRVEPVALERRVLLAQTRLAVEEENALTVDDVLLRRVEPGALDLEACWMLARWVALEMAEPLGWNRDDLEAQVEAFRRGVEADLRAARGDLPISALQLPA